MKAALLRSYGGPVEVSEVPKPSTGPGDVLIRVQAASINPIDWKTQDGKVRAILPYRLPFVLGSDCSGVVEAVGAQVTRFKVGDEIMARVGKDRIGTFADYVVMHEGDAALRPPALSPVEAASLPLVGLTSWQALIDIAQLQAGQRVLIHAGAGGIGTFALQLAHHLGAHTLTTASPRDFDRLRALGADELIDYHTQDFATVAKDVDMVFDTLGGETLSKSFQVVKRGGVVVSIAAMPYRASLDGYPLSIGMGLALDLLNAPTFLRARQAGARYVYLLMKSNGEQLEKIATLVQQGKLKPVVDRVFPLAEAQAALQYVKAGKAKGKVVLEMT